MARLPIARRFTGSTIRVGADIKFEQSDFQAFAAMKPSDFAERDSDLPPFLATRVAYEDFFAYMPEHKYIFVPTSDLWPAASVNARLPMKPLVKNGAPVLDDDGEPVMIKATQWLDDKKAVEQMTWAPGEPKIISGRLVSQGGWIERNNHTVFKLYRPPTLELGDASKAGPWLDHVEKIYPNDAKHIIAWCAHRLQKPGEKINHALMLGGSQGIGKDTFARTSEAGRGRLELLRSLAQASGRPLQRLPKIRHPAR